MHSITLSFLTFADAAAALAKLAGTAEHAIVADVKAAEQAVVKAVTGKTKAEKPAASPAQGAAASEQKPSASAPAASATPPASDAAVDYPTLQKAVFKLAGIAAGGRDAATELLAQFEVKTFKDLASARWSEALAAVNAKIDSLSVPA